MPTRSVLHLDQILNWADTFHKHAGKWPSANSGRIVGADDDTWAAVQGALASGCRGLPGGSSLARFLSEHRGKRLRAELNVEQILEWADAHYKHTGKWPSANSGRIVGADDDTWGAVQMALVIGRRGLPGGSSLARFLSEHRRKRLRADWSELTVAQILKWADAHYKRTGKWPSAKFGRIVGAAGGTWRAIQMALMNGGRGLPGGSSLPRLLSEHRGKQLWARGADLIVDQILKWADAHFKRTGKWPTARSGRIVGGADSTWSAVDVALASGNRGLPGGSTLARLLSEHRGKQLWARGADLTVEQILKWADAHLKRTREWPTAKSGRIVGAAGETWTAIQSALVYGSRGLPGGSTLARLLSEHRGEQLRAKRGDLTVEQILKWADAHYKRTGKWPMAQSGRIVGADGTWGAVQMALVIGGRGLPDGSSLARLLSEHRGKRLWAKRSDLTVEQILKWADAHFKRNGKWPTARSGRIVGADDATWTAIQGALVSGSRGLPRGSTLARFLSEHRGKRFRAKRGDLTVEQVRAWADAHHKRTGTWPTPKSGPVVGAKAEKWIRINQALQLGYRGLPGGSSLVKLLATHRGKQN